MRISVCIPTYEMKGKGVDFLTHSFLWLEKQTFQDFEVIVSDHSENDDIKNLCKSKGNLDIKYIRNEKNRGSSSSNLNNALQKAIGEVIKILFQDDYICDTHCLEMIQEKFQDSRVSWVVNGTIHTSDGNQFFNPLIPRYNKTIHLGNNTISSPSVLAIRNKEVLPFDEKLSWLMDVEYYKRLYEKHGEPTIIENILVVNRLWDGQISNSMITQDIINEEVSYVKAKHS